MKHVSLHHHSTYSYMDGFGTPAQHAARIAELGMEAMALTEHGNVSSHVQLEKASKKLGIKPIFGLEAYTEVEPKSRRKFHLTILAQDQEGYRNLMRIVQRSWDEGFYQWPTVSGRMLSDHNEGLIVLSGCSDSLLACSLLGGKTIDPSEASPERAERQARRFKELLGDRFYLETQMFPELERTGHINQFYEQLGKRLKIPLVASGDVHYPQPNDNEMQVILHAAGRGAGTVAAQEASWEYDIRLCPPDSDSTALQLLGGTGLGSRAALQAVSSTEEIAARCNVVLPKAELLRYPTEPGETSIELIWRLMREGWKYRVRHGNKRMQALKKEYVERVKFEMEEIRKKDYIDYFLMLSDIVRHSKDNHIAVGPARGSAAASLVCYLLRITEIDPMQYPLMMFDRFIDPTRTDIPDIDLDFDDERRYLVREYAVERYGADRVGNIANYSRFKGKTAVNDICRVFKIPPAVAKAVNDRVVERSGGDSRDNFSLLDTVEMFPTVKALFDRYPDLYKATRLEGNYRGMSVHAAGLVIANTAITDVCGLYTRKSASGQITVVSVDKYDAEYLGLMKADFLGLSTMGMLRIALDLAGLTLEDMYHIQMDDPDTIKAFHDNDVVGIFQFEGRATRLVCREVKPESFLEISDVNALSRPGPLFSGTTAEYIDVKRGKKKPTSFHPIIDDLTVATRGQIIYQEQILKGLRDFGGLPVTRVHEIRRIISKKLGEAQFNTSSQNFIDGAVELHGVTPEIARSVWGRLVTSASYAFNIAHSISYSMLGFWCMWLKVHYPVAFYTAQLRKTEEEKWRVLIKDAERHGVKVSGVDPQRSGRTWTPVGGAEKKRASGGQIRAGLLQLPGIGEAKVKAIEEFRAAGGQLNCADDFRQIKGIGPKMVEKLQGSVDNVDPFGLNEASRKLRLVRRALKDGEIPLAKATHTSDGLLDVKGDTPVIWIGIAHSIEYKDYVENQRSRYGTEVEEIRAKMKRPDLVTFASIRAYDDGDEDVYLRFNRFDFPRFRAAIEGIRVGLDVLYVRAIRNDSGFGCSMSVKQMHVIDPEG